MNPNYLWLDPAHVAPRTWNPKPPRGPLWPRWRRDVSVLVSLALGVGLVSYSVHHSEHSGTSGGLRVSLMLPRNPRDKGDLWAAAPAPRCRVARVARPSSVAPPMTDMPLYDDRGVTAQP